jgi:FlaA1/EpsC-like NDP-sugar epimerase
MSEENMFDDFERDRRSPRTATGGAGPIMISHQRNYRSQENVMNRFEGKTVLVTGGNSGMGLTTAQAYAAEGARVVITGRDEVTLAAAKATLGAQALAIRNDAGSVAAARELARVMAEQDIRLDAVFVNAGIAKFAPLADVDEAMWDETPSPAPDS